MLAKAGSWPKLLFALLRVFTCKAFCEFLLRTVFDKDYLRLPYNKQKGMEPKFCTVSLLLENCGKKYNPKGFP